MLFLLHPAFHIFPCLDYKLCSRRVIGARIPGSLDRGHPEGQGAPAVSQVPGSGHLGDKIILFRKYLGTRPLWALGMQVGTGQPWSPSFESLQVCWVNPSN